MQTPKARARRWLMAPLLVVLLILILAAPAQALVRPWNGQPISQGLGPTYGEAWPISPAEAGEAAIASRQGAPLALMPWADIKPLLDQFRAEASAAGVPPRMTYEVLGQSAEGRDIYGVVINAMETPEQVRGYNRWKAIRSLMLTSPVEAQELLTSYGDDVKMCVYQSHIHGNEYEAVDANMQIIRDLTVTPRGVNPTVDKILDNEIVVVLMDNNPDGRVNGTRGNPTGFDPNRDFFVQSQPEQKVAVAFMHRWLPTGFIEGHGYYTPTLIDGTTIPHNPGIEEDTFQHWNVQRIERNRSDFAASGVTGITTIQSPIRDWNEQGGTSTRNYTVVGTPYTIAAGPSAIANTSGGGATEVGTTVTITTSSAHNLAVDYTVVIAGVGVNGYNGTWTVASIVSPTKFTYTNTASGLAASGNGTVACSAINGASESGTTATITTTTANTLVVGDTVNVFGVSVAGYNGTFTVTSIVSPTQFTYTNPTSGLANAGGGGVTSPSVAATATGATESGNTVTITTTATNIVAQGYKVVISGVLEAGYNGTFQVASVISPTQFTYTNPTSGLADSGGGNVALPPQPNLAQTWDDWGPFYGQSYSALLGGPDGSTVEMTSANRMLSKQAQYLAFYSSNSYWVDNKAAMMHDHLGNFIRGYTSALPNPAAFDDDPVLSSRYYSDIWQNYMLTYPMAYVIPWGDGQRSDTEANNLVTWLLRNNVLVTRATADFTWQATTYKAGSYVVWMAQPFRGIAWNALAAGVELSGTKITSLYASPAAWSHGLCWGADVVEVPHDDATFLPTTVPVSGPSDVQGGVRDGLDAPSDWYSVALRGVHEYPGIRSLLKSGIKAQMAETSFESTTGGTMPAGTLIFPASAKEALDEAGLDAGIWFERNVGVTMPAATAVQEAPKIAVLVTTVPSGQSETSFALDSIFAYDATGKQQSIHRLVTESDWDYVATNDSTGPKGLNNPDIGDPLAGYDVVYTTLTAWPSSATYPLAVTRLNDFFARGGGYLTQNVSSAAFLTGATPSALLTGTLTRSSSSAQGGIVLVNNVGSVNSPITGPEPSTDTLFVPSTVYWYSALPNGAVVDQQYPANIATIGTQNGFVAGLWNSRSTGANNGPVLFHGKTTLGDRYMFYNTNAFSRGDAEREWLYFVQAALWSNLTDEVVLDSGPASQSVQYGSTDAIQTVTFSAGDANAAGSAMSVSAPDLPAGLVVTQTSDNGSTTPGAASWTITGSVTAPAGDYPVTLTVTDGGARPVGTLKLTFTVDPKALTVNATGHGKTYDGKTDATVDLVGVGLVTGDEVTFKYTAATFASAGVGTDIPVAVQGISIGGADAANYQLASVTAEAKGSISPAALAITATDQSKLYGNTFVFTGTEFKAGGLVAGEAIDTVTLTSDGAGATQAPGTYAIVPSGAQPHVGTTLGNYTVTYVNGTMTVTGGYKITAFAKPLRESDPRRFSRGRTIRVAFKVKDWDGNLVTTVKPRITVKTGSKVVLGPKTVKYNKAKKMFVYDVRTAKSWKLAKYSIKVTLEGSLGRSVSFKLIK